MKAKNKQHVCRYTHCYYGNTEIPPDDEIKVGNRYMHKKCAIASQSIQKAKELYYENISSTVVMSQLLNVINNIIFTKNVDPEYLVFAIQHAISAKIQIKSPYSLHYLIDNSRIKQLWEREKKKRISTRMMEEIKHHAACSENEPKFTSPKQKNESFMDIFGGD